MSNQPNLWHEYNHAVSEFAQCALMGLGFITDYWFDEAARLHKLIYPRG